MWKLDSETKDLVGPHGYVVGCDKHLPQRARHRIWQFWLIFFSTSLTVSCPPVELYWLRRHRTVWAVCHCSWVWRGTPYRILLRVFTEEWHRAHRFLMAHRLPRRHIHSSQNWGTKSSIEVPPYLSLVTKVQKYTVEVALWCVRNPSSDPLPT